MKNYTSKNRLTLVTFFLFAMTFCLPTNSSGQMKHVVNATDYKFTPAELHVSVGDTVEWKNTQGYHNVNGSKSAFPSNPEPFGNALGFGWTYSYVFKTAGTYEYHCDPHVGFGMKGKIEVMDSGGNDDDKYNLTINFTGMNPHVGQVLWLEVVEKTTGKAVERKKQTVSTNFSVEVAGIEKDHSYFVNFYADHNNNGKYDVPPVDHAWRMELNHVSGNSVLEFAHNTNFTNIEWKNKLMIHFMNMNPHVGQTLKLAVTDKNSGVEISRLSETVSVDFMVEIFGIEKDKSYNIDFFADHNKNGAYNTPPADHAWRLQLNNVNNDTIINFIHNTNFTDIKWRNELALHFIGMTPHLGQNLWLSVIDKETGISIDTVTTTIENEFMVYVKGILSGKSYQIDFFADHNKNGSYDKPPTDHAWRLELLNVKSDTMMMFMHNTNFTDIFGTTSNKTIQDITLKMYPNPAIDRIFIEQDIFSGDKATVSVYDLTGKLRYSETVRNSNKIEINIQNLSNGIYFVNMRTIDKQNVLKLIKY